MPPPSPDTHRSTQAILDSLRARGQLYQCTDESALAAHLAEPRSLYCGFDPTADSLTIGNLVPIMLLRRFKQAGHAPVVLMGGATGRIGDPSGKEVERQLLTDQQVDTNIEAQRPIFEALLGADVQIVNNYDWFRDISFIDALRDIGKHFSINEMIKRDSVRRRLEREDVGISFTEFSYMLLQAYDFLHLYREQGVTMQCAGSDQWGNIASGVELIRKSEGHDASGGPLSFGLTAPLLTKSDGGKFGKTESGSIWLTHQRPSKAPGTSPYAYYQFWLNTSDVDVKSTLLIFTDLSPVDIDDLCARHEQAPHAREAQRTLAREATTMLHGEDAMNRAEHAAQALFSGDVARLDLESLEEVFSEVASTNHSKSELAGEGIALIDLLARTSLCTSKREAREHLSSGAVSVNGVQRSIEDRLREQDLLHGSLALIRRGKKAWCVTRWE